MLREFIHVRQESGPGRRRWFESEAFDLIIWLDAEGEVVGYQICYLAGSREYALTWRMEQGFAHHVVDDGESRDSGGKLTPILVAAGEVPWSEIALRFARQSASLDPDLRNLVARTLADQK